MPKTFTCEELGGVCDQKFSAETCPDLIHKAMPHMMSDEAHKASITGLERRTGENQAQWMARIQEEFDARPEDT